jgi:hypothetical protein
MVAPKQVGLSFLQSWMRFWPGRIERGSSLFSTNNQRELHLSSNLWLSQPHCWLSIFFTVAVIANFVAMGLGEPPPWIVCAPLPPLFLVMFTGL